MCQVLGGWQLATATASPTLAPGKVGATDMVSEAFELKSPEAVVQRYIGKRITPI
jgi:hypothetical protein